MKYICLGYIDPNKLPSLPESEMHAMMDECFTYDDELREKGHFAGGHALQPPQTAATLRWENGKVSVTDGPFAETKEQLAGYYIIPSYTLRKDRIAHWDRFSHPDTLPVYSIGFPEIWWYDDAKATKTGKRSSLPVVKRRSAS